MAIQYAGGTLDVRTVVVGAVPVADLVTTMAASTAAAGWTVSNLSQFNILHGLTNASNGQTVTISGRVYTFVTVLSAADDIAIGAGALDTLQNFKAAINGAAGSGTKYGVGTVASATVTCDFADIAALNGSQRPALVIHTQGTLSIAVSESSNYTWFASTLASVLYRMVSVETPQYQQVYAYVGADPNAPAASLCMFVMNRDQSTGIGQIADRAISNGQTYRFITHRYGFHCHLVGTYNTRGTGLYLQVPYLPGNIAPNKIIGATNTTPIIMQTSASHGYITGDSVLQRYVEGNTAANGTFTVTVTDATHYSLDASVGNGAFSGTKGLAKNLTPPRIEILEFSFANFINNSSDEWSVSSAFYFGVGTGQPAFFGISDGSNFINATTFEGYFPVAVYRNGSGTLTPYVWASGAYVALEPSLVFINAYGGSARGPQLYNAALGQSSAIPGGATTTFDSHTWFGAYNNDSRDQLLLVTA